MIHRIHLRGNEHFCYCNWWYWLPQVSNLILETIGIFGVFFAVNIHYILLLTPFDHCNQYYGSYCAFTAMCLMRAFFRMWKNDLFWAEMDRILCILVKKRTEIFFWVTDVVFKWDCPFFIFCPFPALFCPLKGKKG